MSESTSASAWVSAVARVAPRSLFMATLGYEPLGETDAVDPLHCGVQLAFHPTGGGSAAQDRSHFDVFVPAERTRPGR